MRIRTNEYIEIRGKQYAYTANFECLLGDDEFCDDRCKLKKYCITSGPSITFFTTW